VLTVQYDRLGLQPGERLLDLGCGFGRHAFEAGRRGAHVVALDRADTELKEVRNTFGAMADVGEVDESVCVGTVQGDATTLPFADGAFDRIIASEVLEHVVADSHALAELARVLRPGGVLAATVPAEGPEKICWRLSDAYHAPIAIGGHVRIYSVVELSAKLRAAGLQPFDRHRAHALHSPYWWLRCAVGPENGEHPLVRAYRRFLEWDIIKGPRGVRVIEHALDPVLGKSVVIYAKKPM
jgi:SAM-dependent methyltransferase